MQTGMMFGSKLGKIEVQGSHILIFILEKQKNNDPTVSLMTKTIIKSTNRKKPFIMMQTIVLVLLGFFYGQISFLCVELLESAISYGFSSTFAHLRFVAS